MMYPNEVMINGEPAPVIDLPVEHVKYLNVQIKSPGFSLFDKTIPVRGDFSVKSIMDRFHNLHPDVENSVKRIGHMYPAIEWRYLHPTMDIVIEYTKSEWIRLQVVERPKSWEIDDGPANPQEDA